MAFLTLDKLLVFLLVFLCYLSAIWGETDPSDMEILQDFRKGLENSELLEWPEEGDPCGPPSWPHIFCVDSRVSQIQVQNLSLKGPLPPNLNKLSMLSNLGLQRNHFSGKLPSFSGLSQLQYAYLGYNNFDTIPGDFFDGLDKLEVLSLDYNPLNESGWQLPLALRNSAQLMNLSLMKTNLVGPLPDFLGAMSLLTALKLSFNKFSGPIPATYAGAQFQVFWLNGQSLTGPIDSVASMLSLQQLWLHNNQFSGTIPAGLADCTSLYDLQLYGNQLVGPVPPELASLQLKTLKLNTNKLSGPIPKFKGPDVDFSGNSFCQTDPGVPCSPEVTFLLDFLAGLGYPSSLASSWAGNDPCTSWLGIACTNKKVSVINLPHWKLNGTLSPSVGKLHSIERIILGGNNLTGTIPKNYTDLRMLKVIDLSDNNLVPPVPSFSDTVKIVLERNPSLTGDKHEPPSNPDNPSKNITVSPGEHLPSAPGKQQPSSLPGKRPKSENGTARVLSNHRTGFLKTKSWIVIIPVVVVIVMLMFFFAWCVCRRRVVRRKRSSGPPFVVHPGDSSNSDVKIVVADQANRSLYSNPSGSQSMYSSTGSNTRTFDSGSLVVSLQVLREVTGNFAPENELGRGGFGTVYRGALEDGTVIAVKRMESSALSGKALNEFQSEIAVLSKVRHRHLVSLLGYSVEGHEKVLVYEYMPQGALSKHLFQWKLMNLEPLSWKRRISIALDVARGMEYLHNLAQQSFIHRDLKSSNILLGDDFRAKVSDFGLVKLAPDGTHSVATRLAGTFGYLAPEYAVMGKVTTKADVFSFGVVLMELVTGLTALDEHRDESKRYLAEYFWRVKSSKELLQAAVDPAINIDEETLESICTIAELAGHCTARDPYQRPDMSHPVSVLSPLVEKWKPTFDEREEYMGIDCSQPLRHMVQVWQATDDTDSKILNLEDSRGSIPPAPTGFADSFTSNDAR